MFNLMDEKEHYKMYKKGKAWVFAGILTATFILGAGGVQTAKADTTTTGDNVPAVEVSAKNANSSANESTVIKTSTGSESGDKPADKVMEPSVDKSTSDTEDKSTSNTEDKPAGTPDDVDKPTKPEASDMSDKDATLAKEAPVNDQHEKKVTAGAATPSERSRSDLLRSNMVAPVEAPSLKASESIDDWMPDKNLQTYVYYSIKGMFGLTSPDQITKDMLAQVKNLSTMPKLTMQNKEYFMALANVKTLEGLQYATNLESISIYPAMDGSIIWTGTYVMGQLSDISAIANLQKLTEVNFQQNNLTDISALAKLHLTSVSLSYNHITDVSPLQGSVSTLPEYATLDFQTVKLPGIILNSKTKTYTAPSFIIKTADGGNVPITGVSASKYYGLNSGATATNVSPTTVSWSNFTANTGYLFMDWNDPLFGQAGYAYGGEIIVPYLLSDTVGNVNVNFKKADGTVLAPQITMSGDLGTDFDLNKDANVMNTVASLMNKGLQYKGTENGEAITGVYAEDASNITLIFGEKQIATTFNYLDDKGNTLAPSQTMTGTMGQSWQVAVPGLTGYTFKSANQDGTPMTVTDNLLSGTLTANSNVNLIYAAKDETATVHYVYADGTKAADDKMVTGKFGDTIAFPTSPVISGYTPSTLTAAKYGDGAMANVFTVTYTKDPVTPVTPGHQVTVTVHYQDVTGKMVAPDEILTGNSGDYYTATPKTVKGYTLTSTPDNATGIFGDNDSEMTYVYTAVTNGGEGDTGTPKPGKPNKPGKETPNKGGQAAGITPGKHVVPTKGGAAAVVTSLSHSTSLTSKSTKTTLPQTSDKATSPFLGLAVLGTLLGLAGLKRRKHNH